MRGRGQRKKPSKIRATLLPADLIMNGKHPRSVAMERGDTHYFTGIPCKHGHIAKRRVKDRVCTECDSAAKKIRSEQNPEKTREYKKTQYVKHKSTHLAQKRVYRQSNKGKINALVAKRKAQVKLRTPSWADTDKIKSYYEVCAFFNEVNGYIKYHVDHVIPLQGSVVSGLHVENNLQIIPWLDNIRKKNKFEVCCG